MNHDPIRSTRFLICVLVGLAINLHDVNSAEGQNSRSKGKPPAHSKSPPNRFPPNQFQHSQGRSKPSRSNGQGNRGYPPQRGPEYAPKKYGDKYRKHIANHAFLDISPLVWNYGNPNGSFPSAFADGYQSPFVDAYDHANSYSLYQSFQSYDQGVYGLPPHYRAGATYRYVPMGLTPTEATAAADLLGGEPMVQTPNSMSLLVPTNAAAQNTQFEAERAFNDGQYGLAVEIVNEAMRLDPENSLLLLFASQSNFAVGNYSVATEYLERATANLGTDHWGHVIRNYRKLYGRNDYVGQMDRLNQHLAAQPADAAAWALRGYHFGSLQYLDAAVSDFDQAIKSDPNQALANRLRRVLKPDQPTPSPPAIEEIPAPVPSESRERLPEPPETLNRESDSDTTPGQSGTADQSGQQNQEMQIHGPTK